MSSKPKQEGLETALGESLKYVAGGFNDDDDIDPESRVGRRIEEEIHSLKRLINSEVTSVLDEASKQIQSKLSEPDQQWESDIIVNEAIQSIRSRYE